MDQSISTQSIMSAFADATGLSNTSSAPRRYLWTINGAMLAMNLAPDGYLQL